MGYKEKLARANEIVQRAEAKYRRAQMAYEKYTDFIQSKHDRIGRKREIVQKYTLPEFAASLNRFKSAKIRNHEFTTTKVEFESLGGLGGFDIDLTEIGRIQENMGWTAAGLGVGVPLAATAASGMVASTAAAGLLASVSVVAPIFAIGAVIFGFWKMNEKAEQALTDAESYAADVDYAIEEMNVSIAKLSGFEKRIDEIQGVIDRLDSRLAAMTKKINSMPNNPTIKKCRQIFKLELVIFCLLPLLYPFIGEFIFLVILMLIIGTLYLRHVQDNHPEIEPTVEDQQYLYAACQVAFCLREVLSVELFDEELEMTEGIKEKIVQSKKAMLTSNL